LNKPWRERISSPRTIQRDSSACGIFPDWKRPGTRADFRGNRRPEWLFHETGGSQEV